MTTCGNTGLKVMLLLSRLKTSHWGYFIKREATALLLDLTSAPARGFGFSFSQPERTIPTAAICM